MRRSCQLERWLALEVLDRELPSRKPPVRQRRGATRDGAYRAWIRTLPCVACGSTWNVEAAHTGRDGGMSIKSSDYTCVPLCSHCHRQAPHAYHVIGRDAFEQRHSLSFPKIAARLNNTWGTAAFTERQSTTAGDKLAFGTE